MNLVFSTNTHTHTHNEDSEKSGAIIPPNSDSNTETEEGDRRSGLFDGKASQHPAVFVFAAGV